MNNDNRPSYEIARETIEQFASEHGLAIRAAFVSFSASRNAKPAGGRTQAWESLNWKLTLTRNGADVLNCDYSQGVAYCPALKRKWATPADSQNAIRIEIESGRRALPGIGGPRASQKPIEPPAIADVLGSLAMDSDVLNYPNFSDWADCIGYDSDSRSAESTYRQCLEHALALRAALGESALARLCEAAREL